jgi:hypothetical protein
MAHSSAKKRDSSRSPAPKRIEINQLSALPKQSIRNHFSGRRASWNRIKYIFPLRLLRADKSILRCDFTIGAIFAPSRERRRLIELAVMCMLQLFKYTGT